MGSSQQGEKLTMPFSPETRKEIGKKFGWQCECGKAFRDGYMVQASHLHHDSSFEYYDDSDMGVIECMECHLRRHIAIMKELDNNWSVQSTRLLATSIYRDGFMTRRYVESNPDILADDRLHLIEILEEEALDPDYFIMTTK